MKRTLVLAAALFSAACAHTSHAQQANAPTNAEVTLAPEDVVSDTLVQVPAESAAQHGGASRAVVVKAAHHRHSDLWWEIPVAIVALPIEVAMLAVALPVYIVFAVTGHGGCP